MAGIASEANKVVQEPNRKIIPPAVKFVKHLNERLRGKVEDRPQRQIVEATFGRPEDGMGLRDIYSTLNKKWRAENMIPDMFKGVYINPSHTHRTRVRVDILKALAKSIKSGLRGSGGDSWVVAHIPKPVLKVSHGKESSPQTMSFTEAIRWAQARFPVGQQDLLDAYKQAGSIYGETIENQFVLLKSEIRQKNRAEGKRSRQR